MRDLHLADVKNLHRYQCCQVILEIEHKQQMKRKKHKCDGETYEGTKKGELASLVTWIDVVYFSALVETYFLRTTRRLVQGNVSPYTHLLAR